MNTGETFVVCSHVDNNPTGSELGNTQTIKEQIFVENSKIAIIYYPLLRLMIKRA